jgi:hypothetical protein
MCAAIDKIYLLQLFPLFAHELVLLLAVFATNPSFSPILIFLVLSLCMLLILWICLYYL